MGLVLTDALQVTQYISNQPTSNEDNALAVTDALLAVYFHEIELIKLSEFNPCITWFAETRRVDRGIAAPRKDTTWGFTVGLVIEGKIQAASPSQLETAESQVQNASASALWGVSDGVCYGLVTAGVFMKGYKTRKRSGQISFEAITGKQRDELPTLANFNDISADQDAREMHNFFLDIREFFGLVRESLHPAVSHKFRTINQQTASEWIHNPTYNRYFRYKDRYNPRDDDITWE